MSVQNIFLVLSIAFVFFKPCYSQNYSLAFVIDTTGSMSAEVREVKNAAIGILNKMATNEQMSIEKFILVPFNDPSYGPALTTDNPAEFKKKIEAITVSGGGDCPELFLSGLTLALNESLENSYIYVFTDAPAKDYALELGVLDLIQRKKVQVVIILTAGCYSMGGLAVYESITQASSGQILELVKGDISTLMNFIEYTIDQDAKVNLGVVVNPPGYGNLYNISVDITISIISISVSGKSPEIIVMNPSGEIVNNTSKVNVTIALDKIKVVNIIDPEPGKWSVSYGSSTKHSVKIIAVSEIRFEFGFFTDKFTSIVEQPNQGEHTYIVVKIVDDHQQINKLNSLQIIDVNGIIIHELTLIQMIESSSGLMYKTVQYFKIPSFLFSISINGVDINGNPFNRISSTAIMAKVSDIPVIQSIFQEEPMIGNITDILTFHYGDTAAIHCNATGIPMPHITWILPDGNMTNTLCNMYLINAITKENAGVYKCIATNSGGQVEMNTTIIVKERTPITLESIESKSSRFNAQIALIVTSVTIFARNINLL